jgi:hypothetical protein
MTGLLDPQDGRSAARSTEASSAHPREHRANAPQLFLLLGRFGKELSQVQDRAALRCRAQSNLVVVLPRVPGASPASRPFRKVQNDRVGRSLCLLLQVRTPSRKVRSLEPLRDLHGKPVAIQSLVRESVRHESVSSDRFQRLRADRHRTRDRGPRSNSRSRPRSNSRSRPRSTSRSRAEIELRP